MQPLLGRVRSAYAAALLAVALLLFAGVRSNVMQAAELAPSAAAHCAMPLDGMASMTAMAGNGHGEKHPSGKAHAVCDFCVAAAHAAVTVFTAVLPAPQAVAWAPTPLPTSLGPRGPPAFRPKARAPPPALLTA